MSSTPANASTPTPGLALSLKVPVATKNGSARTTSGGANYRPLPPRNRQSDLTSTTGKCKHTSKQKGSCPIHYFEGSSRDEDFGSQSGDGSSSGDTATSDAPTKRQRTSKITTWSLARTPVSDLTVEGASNPPSPAPAHPIPTPVAITTAITTPTTSPLTNLTHVVAQTNPVDTQSTGTSPDTMNNEPSPPDTPQTEDSSRSKVAVLGTEDTEVTDTEDGAITGTDMAAGAMDAGITDSGDGEVTSTDAVVQVHLTTDSLPAAVPTTPSSPVSSTIIEERNVPAFLLSHGKGACRVNIFTYLNKIQDPHFRRLFFHYIKFEMDNQSTASGTLSTADRPIKISQWTS